jgi:hypothetical protein
MYALSSFSLSFLHLSSFLILFLSSPFLFPSSLSPSLPSFFPSFFLPFLSPFFFASFLIPFLFPFVSVELM